MNNKKETNFEINLLPVISLLAVIISFLLLSTVWVDIGTMDVKQAMGESTEKPDKEPPTLWVTLGEKSQLNIEVKDAPDLDKSLRNAVIFAKDGALNLEALGSLAKQIKETVPDINTAMILPGIDSTYEDLIAVMDEFKKNEYSQMGIAPL